ncbi:MAG: hypothetical protein WCS94_17075 [Verrucomicrobiota bacterium]
MKTYIKAFVAITILLIRQSGLSAQPTGEVIGWGGNISGEATGIPTRANATGEVVVASQVLNNVNAIGAGYGHGLALKGDGTVVGWGANYLGKAIGLITDYPYRTNGQVMIDGLVLSNVTAIAAGQTHNLALKNDGTVVAWGSLNSGVKVGVPSSISNVVAIAAGCDGSLALKNDGTVIGWNMRIPAGLSNIVAIAAANTPWSQGLVLRKDGVVIEWSRGVAWENGQVVASNAVAIAEGDAHGLALQHDGTVVEWGSYDSGFSGGGLTNSKLVIIGGQTLSSVVAIAASGDISMALKSDGSVVAWGKIGFYPVTVPEGLSNVVAIAAGEGFCLAITTNRAVAKRFRQK